MRVIKKKDQIMQTLMTMVPAFARKEGLKSFLTKYRLFSWCINPDSQQTQLMTRVAWFDRWQLCIHLAMQWSQKRMAHYNVQTCGHIAMRSFLQERLAPQSVMAMSIRRLTAARLLFTHVTENLIIENLDILCVLCAHFNSIVWLLHGKNWRFAQALHGKSVNVMVWT